MERKRILLVNKFYYSRGGDCICVLNLEKLLREKGHEVAIFSMQYDQNIDTPWSSYFASGVDFSGGVGAKIAAAKRIFGLGDIRRSFQRILDDFKPDVVHFHNIHSYLSPEIVKMAKRSGARTVWTMHDHKLVCPAYLCLRNGHTCELCFHNRFNVVRNRCMKGGLIGSALGWAEAMKWSRVKIESFTDRLISPSIFLEKRLRECGFTKVTTICNSVDPIKLANFKNIPVSQNRAPYVLFLGRISAEKGVEIALEALAGTGVELKLAGDGPMLEPLKAKYAKNPNVHFLGRCDADTVTKLLIDASAMCISSICYENNPLSVIESLCAGTPVVGAEIGGIPELITPANGITFRAGDAADMRRAVNEALSRSWDYEAIKRKALVDFSPDTYYDRIIKVYNPE